MTYQQMHKFTVHNVGKNSHVLSPKSAENLDVNLGFAVAGQGLQHTPRIDGKR